MRPLTAILTKHPPGGVVEAIALLPQPLTETTTRVWIIMALDDFTSDDDVLRTLWEGRHGGEQASGPGMYV